MHRKAPQQLRSFFAFRKLLGWAWLPLNFFLSKCDIIGAYFVYIIEALQNNDGR